MASWHGRNLQARISHNNVTLVSHTSVLSIVTWMAILSNRSNLGHRNFLCREPLWLRARNLLGGWRLGEIWQWPNYERYIFVLHNSFLKMYQLNGSFKRQAVSVYTFLVQNFVYYSGVLFMQFARILTNYGIRSLFSLSLELFLKFEKLIVFQIISF